MENVHQVIMMGWLGQTRALNELRDVLQDIIHTVLDLQINTDNWPTMKQIFCINIFSNNPRCRQSTEIHVSNSTI
jgi:hypothetical protein